MQRRLLLTSRGEGDGMQAKGKIALGSKGGRPILLLRRKKLHSPKRRN